VLRLAVLARSVYPLHGVGGLERHVYDLVRHLIARDVHVTLITKPPIANALLAKSPHADRAATTPTSASASALAAASASDAAAAALGVRTDRLRLVSVPYITFPGAGRRGTTVADRVTAYPFFGWRAGKVAAKLAYCGDVDLVYALGASGLGYAMAHRRGEERTRPFIFNPQGLEEFGATNPEHARLKRIAYGPLQSAVRSCATAADAVIATDHALVPTLLRHLPIGRDRISVIPNGIDLDDVDRHRRGADGQESGKNPRARANIPENARVLVSVGRLEANKGFHVLAHALGLLLRQAPDLDWRWVLVGDGPFRAEIEGAAETAGLTAASRMIVAGRVPEEELHGWYEAADLFVHPTLYEGSSLVTLEAMAHRRAVIATRAGGLPDKVSPGENGWLVDPDRPDQLAEAMVAALHSSPATLEAMGRVSRARVEHAFAWPVIADQLIALCRRLAAAAPRPARSSTAR
jgi:glycosyltransferase involved in cell wall biosynthesis